MDIKVDPPELLNEFSPEEIIRIVRTLMSARQKNIRPRDSKSVFGKAVEQLTKQPSTVESRNYVFQLWQNSSKDNVSPGIDAGTMKKLPKHDRQKQYRELNKRMKDVSIQAEVDLIKQKVKGTSSQNIKHDSIEIEVSNPQNISSTQVTTSSTQSVQPNAVPSEGSQCSIIDSTAHSLQQMRLSQSCSGHTQSCKSNGKRKGTSPHQSKGIFKRIRSTLSKRKSQLQNSVSCFGRTSNDEPYYHSSRHLSLHDNGQNKASENDERSVCTLTNNNAQCEVNQQDEQNSEIETDSQHDLDNQSEHHQVINEENILMDPYQLQIINVYEAKINCYPSFLCPICRRLLYDNRNTVRRYQFSSQIIQAIRELGHPYFYEGEDQRICMRCFNTLKRNKIPSTIFFNKMEVPRSPEEIMMLNDIEMKLISQVRPYMKIYHLAKGQGQLALKGACIHFPQSVNDVIDTLPINKHTADMLIVNETNEASSSKRQFQVRGQLLYAALQKLIEINHLYANITIQEIAEEELQINEIRVNPNVPINTPLHNNWNNTGYKKITESVDILRASICQSSALFNGGNQSIAMAATAIAYSTVQYPGSWSSKDLDNVIITGDNYFDRLAPHRNFTLDISFLTGFITCFETIRVEINMAAVNFPGFLNKVPGSQLRRLSTCIADLINSEYEYALLHVNEMYFGLIKHDMHLFMFDSFCRGPKGKRAAKGSACVIKCSQDTAVSFLSEHIHRNCQPSHSFKNDLPIKEKEKFQLSITPVIIKQGDNNTKSQQTVITPHINVNIGTQGFTAINENIEILRASFHQGTSEYFVNGGSQCCAMSASAAAHTLIKSIPEWDREFLNHILIQGDLFYQQLRPNRNQMNYQQRRIENDFLEAEELTGNIKCVRNSIISCRIGFFEEGNGCLDMVPGSQNQHLTASIQAFLNSAYSNAILTANVYCMALLKVEDDFYLFDSHSRGPVGNYSPDGAACVIKFKSPNSANQASRHIHEVCAPREPYLEELSFNQRKYYEFRIDPILCDMIQEPTNTLEPNLSARSHKTDNDNEEGEVLNKNDKFSNPPLHENHLMLDCVVRADEPNQPTVESFLNAFKENQEVIPHIDLQRQQGRPLFPDIEKRLEELAFVKALPFGKYGCDEERQIKITPLDYFQQRIMGENKNFHSTEYLFYALSRVEAHTIHQKIAVCGNMGTNTNAADNEYNIHLPGLENIHLYMNAIRGSGSYWKKYTGDVLGMIEQLNVPTFFVTISYDDLNSRDAITALWKAKHGTDAELLCEPTEIPYEERKQLLNDYPVAAARHFHNRMNAILHLFKNYGEYIFGSKLVDFTYRIEFQGRGSAHAHMLLYTEYRPDWNTAEGIAFLERNISCSLDVTFKNLVTRYQHHSHRKTCFKKHNVCRFGFPRKPSEETKILDEEEIAKSHGRFVEIKRSKEEVMINNYHPILLQILKCNMDIQAVTGTRAIAYYVGKYMSKGEPTYLRQEIRNIITNFKADSRASYHAKAQKIANAIIKHREIGAQEAAFRLLHLRLRHSSRSFVFVPVFQPENRIRMLRRDYLFSDEPKTGLNIIDRYFLRPDSVQHLCLLEFAAWYKPRTNKLNENLDKDLVDGDMESDEDADDETTSTLLELKNKKGYMCRRKRHAIVRYPRFKPLDQTEDYLYSIILLHTPLSGEGVLRSFESMQIAFAALQGLFRTHADDPIINPDQVDQINNILDQLEYQPPENQDDINQDGYPMFDQEDDEPLQVQNIFGPAPPSGVNVPLRQRVDQLTSEQRVVYERVRNQIIGGSDSSMLQIVQGCAGVGKSFLISVLTELITTLCSGGPRALIKAAPTGLAAFAIQGVTLHKAFSLGVEKFTVAQYIKLGGMRLQERRQLYRHVQFLIIDEFSMVSFEIFRQIHLRCTEIFGNENPFGGLSVILFGDLNQLKPPNGHWIYEQPDFLSHEQNLWDLFEFTELNVVMRQRRRDHFFEILQRLRSGILRREDLAKLKERLLNPLAENYEDMLRKSKDALHIYPTVQQVQAYNLAKLRELESAGRRIYRLRAHDTYGSGLKFGSELPEQLIYQDARKTAGICTNLHLCVGSRVTLKWNVDPLSGLSNGSMGTVRHIVWTALRTEQLQDGDLPESVLVEFDEPVGAEYHSVLPGFESCTIIRPKTFEFVGKQHHRVHRKQIPLDLAFAVTAHKCQGMSLNAVTIYLGSKLFTKAQAYVALSRVKMWEGLYITDIDEKKLLVNRQGKGPADQNAQHELMRLRLIAFLEVPKDELNSDLLENLILFSLEYVTCSGCKEWECACICKK